MPHSHRVKPYPSNQRALRGAGTTWLRASAALVILGWLLLAPFAYAATTMSSDEEIVVEAHEVIDDDLIAWAPYVRIDGIVRGDVVVLGTDIVVEGVVEGDLIAGGKTVYVNGTVNDDTRIAAYATAFGEAARLADDAFVLGYSLETKAGSRVGGTVFAAVRQALLAGQIAESLALRSGALELAGIVAGDVSAIVGGLEGVTHSSLVIDLAIEVPELADGLRLNETARVGGNLDYRAEDDARIESGAQIVGETLREEWGGHAVLPTSSDDPGALEGASPFADAFENFALLVLLGLAFVAVAPHFALRRGDEIQDAPVRAVGWGFVGLVLAVAASVAIGIVGAISVAALAASGSGLALGIAAAAFFLQGALLAPFLVVMLYLAPALASIGIGGVALDATVRRGQETPGEVDFRSAAAQLVVGAAVYSGLCAVPVLGAFVSLFGGLAGLGALALWTRESTQAPVLAPANAPSG